MLNIKVGSILTNGLGGPAYNLLIFGPVNLYIEPFKPPTPTPTPTPEPPSPTPEPPPIMGGGGAGSAYQEEERYYKLTLNVKITKRKSVTRSFIVDKHQQEVIVRRLGKINTAVLKFKVVFRKITRVFTFKWKK